MLSDESTYVKFSSDPTFAYQKDLQRLVDLGFSKKVLNKKENKFLAPSFCRIPTIYTLPKVHKDPKNSPARPIVNSIGSVTARLGQYLDTFLQASVLRTKAYLKDTKNLLQIISEIDLSGKQDVFLVTTDVSSLYTIIQHDDALLALNWALSQKDDIPFEQKVFLKQALDFCLSHNYFFN